MSEQKPTYFPRQWWLCKPFVLDLVRRQYVAYDHEVDGGLRKPLHDGMYWYLYELWQDGCMAERAGLAAGVSRDERVRRSYDVG